MLPALRFLSALLLLSGAVAPAQDIMRLDRPTALRWQAELEDDRRYEPRPGLRPETAPAVLDLLPRLVHVPAERSQQLCADCWVWAGTALVEMALASQYGIRDRLSVQYFHSRHPDGSACCPGSLGDFAAFYNNDRRLVPWSNAGAAFRDQRSQCGEPTRAPLSSIGLLPHYRLNSLTPLTIATARVGRERAVAGIKSALREGRAVYLTIVWSTDPRLDSGPELGTAWHRDRERDLWDPGMPADVQCPMDATEFHAMAIVGYDASDPDPARHYWSVLNSWGATPGRPHGLVRIPMELDYDRRFTWGPLHLDKFSFQVLDVDLEETAAALPSVSLAPSAIVLRCGDPLTLAAVAAGTPPIRFQWFKDGRPLPGQASGCLAVAAAGPGDAGQYRVEATNRLGATLSVPVAVTVLGRQLLGNPDLEQGPGQTAWVLDHPHGAPSPLVQRGSAHSGRWFLRLGDSRAGRHPPRQVSAVQTVTLPAAFRDATLGCWVRLIASQTAQPRDSLRIELRDGHGHHLRTLKTFGNRDAPSFRQWTRQLFDLAGLAGQTVQVAFVANLAEPDPGYAAFELDSITLTGLDAPAAGGVTVAPRSATVLTGASQGFTAQLPGHPGAGFTWSASGGGELEDPAANPAVFRPAPLAAAGSRSESLTVRSPADPGRPGLALVTVKGYDLDADGAVDVLDLARLMQALGTRNGDPGFLDAADLDGDGRVDDRDLERWLTFFNAQE